MKEIIELLFLMNSSLILQTIYFSQENKILAEINEEFYRPAEVDLLYGDSNPIREELGWKPKFSFQDLVKRMVNNDLEIAKKRTFSP